MCVIGGGKVLAYLQNVPFLNNVDRTGMRASSKAHFILYSSETMPSNGPNIIFSSRLSEKKRLTVTITVHFEKMSPDYYVQLNIHKVTQSL